MEYRIWHTIQHLISPNFDDATTLVKIQILCIGQWTAGVGTIGTILVIYMKICKMNVRDALRVVHSNRGQAYNQVYDLDNSLKLAHQLDGRGDLDPKLF